MGIENTSTTTSDHADVEKDAGLDYAHLTNTTIKSFGWENISVTVKDRHSKQPKDILSNINGFVKPGMFLSVKSR